MNGWTLDQMADLAAQDIEDGAYVNLGIGLPELVADHLPPDREILLHSENGLLGMGPKPAPHERDSELINAGKKPTTLLPGGAFFHHADSFAMVRGGHLDLCIMGAFEVSAAGDLANWSNGPDQLPAVGGAMDLASGARLIRAIMLHRSKQGRTKLVKAISLPVTGWGVVQRVYTDLAVLDTAGDHFVVRQLAPGIDLEALRSVTGAPVTMASA